MHDDEDKYKTTLNANISHKFINGKRRQELNLIKSVRC